MNDLLSQLKQFSVIVADTGDFESIRKYQPRDTTTNPSLLLKAAQMPEYAAVVERALADARQEVEPHGQLHPVEGAPPIWTMIRSPLRT